MTKNENISTLLAIILAYFFSYYLHLHWISWASQNPEFFWNNQLMINNVDGYFFGSGVQKILYNMHLDNPRLTNIWDYGTAVITAYLVKFLPVSLDTAMLYLPPIISSLVVIPIILVGRLYSNILWGFFAALIGAIGWSYYNRTLAGYYDTDMFSAMLPMFILYFLLASVQNRSLTYLLFASYTVIIYPWLYDQGLSIVYAMGIMMFLYLILFHRNEKFSYQAIILFSFALMPIVGVIKFLLVSILWFLLKKYDIELKKLQIASVISVLIFLLFGNVFGLILQKVFSYTTKTSTIEGLHFLNVSQTVREAGKIPFEIVANRIIGSILGIMIAVIGYILLLFRKKEFIIALPLWGIGFFAYFGGLRFTVYAVPIAAISAVYFFIWLSQKFEIKKAVIISIGTLFILAPNISHIVGCCEKSNFLESIRGFYPLKSYPYLTPTTFEKREVKVLDKLKSLSNPKDYAVTWWDYGYPIWYYANINTLVDGGKHNEDNFIVSKILTTTNQTLAANLLKLSIKTYVETNTTVAPKIFTKDGKPINVNRFLKELSDKSYNLSMLNRNIYLMLPYRMFNIFRTIAYFSNRDLNSGKTYNEGFFYKGRYRKKGYYLFYIGSLPLDLRKGVIILNKKYIPVKEVDIISYDKSGKLKIQRQKSDLQGLRVVVLENYGEAFVMDDKYYNSSFVQMFMFENYDKSLFEPVILNPMMKIYKVK